MNITWRIGLFAMFTLVNTLPFFQYSGTEFPLLEYCVIASPISAFNSIVNPQSLQSINDREEFHAWIPQCLGLSGWDIIFVFSAIAFLALASWISLVSTAKVLWREVK